MLTLLLAALTEGLLLGGALGTLVAREKERALQEEALLEWRQALGVSADAPEAEVRQICAEQLEAEKGYVTISDWIDLRKGDCIGSFQIGNAPESRYSYTVSIALGGTGEEIFRSNLLEPGFCIPETRLDTPLPEGIYVCSVTFTAYIRDLPIPVGRLAQTTTIAIE